jgi:hypothetical protein
MVKTVVVNILKASARFEFSAWHIPRETKPFYATMLNNENKYGYVCEDLRSLPEGIAMTYGDFGIKVIPRNLAIQQNFREINLSDQQLVKLVHQPLSNHEYSDFLASAIDKINFFNNYQREQAKQHQELIQQQNEVINRLEQQITELNDERLSYLNWHDEGGK